MNSINYNIRLNIKTLKDIFEYFKMDEKNTIIELNTKREKVRDNLEEYKDKILLINDKSIYLSGLPFGKLFYFLSKNFIPHVIFYKTKSIEKIKDSEVKIELDSTKIGKISFNEKYDINKTKDFLKKYKSINIEYIVLLLMLLGGIIVFILR